MRQQPKDVHREVLRRVRTEHSDEPTWYAVWLGLPHAEGSELLGRTERLSRPRWWRVFPATGEYPRSCRGWSETVRWLLEVRDGHAKTADTVTATEHEEVTNGTRLHRDPRCGWWHLTSQPG